MLNIPVLSIVIFCLIFIPSFVIGYLRGWKSALFISLVLLAMMGGFLGLALGLYDFAWWPAFKGLFIDKAGGTGNLEAFKDIAKPTVVGLVMMCATPLAYATALLLHIPFKEKLKRSLYPTITKNPKRPEEYTLSRGKNATQRAIGATISGTTGLLMASTVVAGVESITVPSKKGTFISNIARPLANVYTFGHGGYSNPYQIAYEFLPYTKNSNAQAAFNALANIDQNALNDSDGDGVIDIVQNILLINDSSIIDHVHDLTQSGEAFVAILKTLDHNAGNRFQLWNQKAGTTDGINPTFFNDLRNAFSGIHLGLGLDSDSIETIVSYLDSKVASFETTDNEPGSSWYVDWKNVEQQIATEKETLEALKAQLAELKSTLIDLNNKKANIITELQRRENRLRELDGTTTSSIDWATKDFNAKETDYQISETKFQNFFTTMFEPTRLKYENLRTQFQIAEDSLNSAKQEFETKTNELAQLNAQLANYRSTVTTNTNEINRLNTSNASLASKIVACDRDADAIDQLLNGPNGLMAQRDSMNLDLTSKNAELQSLQRDLVTATSTKNTLESEIRNLETQLANPNLSSTERTNLTNQKTQKSNQLISVNQNILSLNSQIAALTNVVNKLSSNVTSLTGDISAKQAERSRILNDKNGYQTDKANNEFRITQLTSLNDDINNNQIPQIENAIRVKQGEVYTAQSNLNTRQSQYDNAKNLFEDCEQNEFTPVNNQNTKNQNERDSRMAARDTARQHLDSLISEKAMLEDNEQNPGSIIYQQKLLTDIIDQIASTETSIHEYENQVDGKIIEQERLIKDLETNPATGEAALRKIRDDQKELYLNNIEIYNEIIRELLRS